MHILHNYYHVYFVNFVHRYLQGKENDQVNEAKLEKDIVESWDRHFPWGNVAKDTDWFGR